MRNVTSATQTIYEVNRNLQPGQQLQVDWSKEGGDVVVTRTIRDLQGNTLERQDFATFYQPWSAVIQVPSSGLRGSAQASMTRSNAWSMVSEKRPWL